MISLERDRFNPLYNSVGTKEIRLVVIYRYFSFGITSLFYLLEPMQSTVSMSWSKPLTIATGEFGVKLAVVALLAVAAVLLNRLYISNGVPKRLLLVMLLLETAGNVGILVPTGGWNSPYVWYSINTLIISSCYFNTRVVLFNFIVYLVSLGAMFVLVFSGYIPSLTSLLLENSNTLLGYAMVVFAIHSMIRLARRLTCESNTLAKINKELSNANQVVEDSVGRLGVLYQSIQNFTTTRNEEKLCELMVDHISSISGARLAFSCITSKQQERVFKTSSGIEGEEQKLLFEAINRDWTNYIQCEGTLSLQSGGKNYIAAAVQISHFGYGVLGVESKEEDNSILGREIIKQLVFLATLSAIVLERFKTEEVNRQLLITEEQNRIANEIHDSVSQRLFFVSGKVGILSKTCGKRSTFELQQELSTVREVLIAAMKELRETIYCYDGQHNDASALDRSISGFLDEISKLYKVNIEYHISGSQEWIGYELKKAIYRIVCESVGNSIRHGNSLNIRILLSIDQHNISLMIEDDGIGFDVGDKTGGTGTGLGLRNMYNLANWFNGSISIKSKKSYGTSIRIEFPFRSCTAEKGLEVVG